MKIIIVKPSLSMVEYFYQVSKRRKSLMIEIILKIQSIKIILKWRFES
jgi:hypothetical protein